MKKVLVVVDMQNDFLFDALRNEEAIKKVREIDEQLKEENEKEVADNKKVTQLMFEQLLRGLYINQYR
jgi:nicotinamidase-related amidase